MDTKKSVMNLGRFESCRCRKLANKHALCDGDQGFAEQGKAVRFNTKQGESVAAIVMDGCIFQDNKPKCDGLFLWAGNSRKAAALVELKGAGDLDHAFAQLAFVKNTRPEYREILAQFNAQQPKGTALEKCFLISNGRLSKTKIEKLENNHGIRVHQILHSEATTPIPDLRKLI